MAKYSGVVGYGISAEVSPGVWEDTIVEKTYYGDVIRNVRDLQESQNLNPNLVVGNAISIVADAYANEHFFAIRYVSWQGALWTVNSVEVQRPRLVLRLREKYNGPTAA